MKLHPDHRRFKLMLAYALRNGGRQTGIVSYAWDVSGRCENPKGLELVSRPPAGADGNIEVPRDGGPLILRMEVACRRCRPCLWERSRKWRDRAVREIAASPRSWFGTLTLSHDEQFRALSRARKAASISAAGDFDTWSEPDRFKGHVKAISPELTLWLKRVRKQSAAPLRYLLVAEAHKSGLPHFHVLVHETSLDNVVRKRVLETQWKLGYSHWRIVKDKSAAKYITKYLAKTMLARVRASKYYGSNERSMNIENRAKLTPFTCLTKYAGKMDCPPVESPL